VTGWEVFLTVVLVVVVGFIGTLLLIGIVRLLDALIELVEATALRARAQALATPLSERDLRRAASDIDSLRKSVREVDHG
jgi:uncharacterized oligopeptide transporter (OPT) family protein